MTNTTQQENNKWTLNTQLHLLTLNERKDAIVLLYLQSILAEMPGWINGEALGPGST